MAKGEGASALVAPAAYLNSDNVPTPRGSTWHDQRGLKQTGTKTPAARMDSAPIQPK